jgi:hypothetical protein
MLHTTTGKASSFASGNVEAWTSWVTANGASDWVGARAFKAGTFWKSCIAVNVCMVSPSDRSFDERQQIRIDAVFLGGAHAV